MAALGLGASPERGAALALSGGGDSVALLLLLARWAKKRGAAVQALIVDHGLRPEAHEEAARAARWAEAAGLPAHILRWRGAKPAGNIEDAARSARYRLMGEWCRARGVGQLFVAHTRDDLAETFLLRLGRGSGVDGLSAMRPRGGFPMPGFAGLALLRPLIEFGREELRAYLTSRKAGWIEDPMNEDSRFLRTRVRGLLPALEQAGIPRQRIAAAAEHLARARDALESGTEAVLSARARFDPAGFALVDGSALRGVPREIGLRAFARVLMAVSQREYRPRMEALERAFDSLNGKGAARTLHGCRIGLAPVRLREFGAETLLVQRESPRRAGAPGKDRLTKSAF